MCGICIKLFASFLLICLPFSLIWLPPSLAFTFSVSAYLNRNKTGTTNVIKRVIFHHFKIQRNYEDTGIDKI